MEGDNTVAFVRDLWQKWKGLVEREVFIKLTKNEDGQATLMATWSENPPVLDDMEFVLEDFKQSFASINYYSF